MASFTTGPCFSKAATRPAGLGASATTLAILAPHCGSAGAGAATTGSSRFSTAFSGMQVSAHTRKDTSAFSVTV
jgi:hypothetical protein